MKSLIASVLCGISPLVAEPAMADALETGKIAVDCHVGTYRLANGRVIDIAPDDDKTLDWRALSDEMGELHRGKDGSWTGTYGWTDRPDGKTVSFTTRDKGGINFANEPGQRIPFDVKDTTFQSNGVKLAGKLIMPCAKAGAVA